MLNSPKLAAVSFAAIFVSAAVSLVCKSCTIQNNIFNLESRIIPNFNELFLFHRINIHENIKYMLLMFIYFFYSVYSLSSIAIAYLFCILY